MMLARLMKNEFTPSQFIKRDYSALVLMNERNIMILYTFLLYTRDEFNNTLIMEVQQKWSAGNNENAEGMYYPVHSTLQ